MTSALAPHRARLRLPTDWRLLCGLPISNSVTFRRGEESRNAFLFFSFYLEGVRLAHCSVLVRFPCGKHTAVPRPDMLLHTTLPLPPLPPSIPWCSHTALSGSLHHHLLHHRPQQQHTNMQTHVSALTITAAHLHPSLVQVLLCIMKLLTYVLN